VIQQKILSGPAGQAQVAELRGVAVGFDDDGRLVVVGNNLQQLDDDERLRVAHALADILGVLVPSIVTH
jgi:nitrate reductase NapAB chaperone NapD